MNFLSKYRARVALVSASAVACCMVACGPKQGAPNAAMMMMAQQVPVRAVPAVAADVPLLASAVGNVQAMSSVDVKSRVAGQILHVYLQDGQMVQEGQLLFEIDPQPLREQIVELQADVAKDVAMEAQARANVAKDVAQQKQSRASADRALELAKEGIFSKEQTEQSVATADAAQASLDADKAAVESAVASSQADRARLAQTQLQLTYTKITAPISGRAGAVAIKAGNLIKDNDTALVTILQLSPVYVSFGLPEDNLSDVRKFDATRPLTIQAITPDKQTENGILRFVDSSIDANTGTITLKGVFDNQHQLLWPGQFVDVNVTLAVEKDRIVIPSRTVETGPQGKYVWVVKADNTAAMQPVSVLRLYKPTGQVEQAVIGTGLTAGQMVVSEGQMRLMPGAKIRLLSEQAGQPGGGGYDAGAF